MSKHMYKTITDIKRIFSEGAFENVKSQYDDQYVQQIDKFNNRPQYQRELEAVVKTANIDESDYILDFGCNTGYAMEKITNETCCSVRGIEQNQRAVKSARKKRPSLSIDSYQGRELPYENNTFDICMINHVIGHVPNPIQSLSEVRRVLIDGGKVCIITPNKYYKIGMIPQNLLNEYEPDPTVLRYYSKTKLREQLESVGFRVTHSETMGEVVPWLQYLEWDSIRLRLLTMAKKD